MTTCALQHVIDNCEIIFNRRIEQSIKVIVDFPDSNAYSNSPDQLYYYSQLLQLINITSTCFFLLAAL